MPKRDRAARSCVVSLFVLLSALVVTGTATAQVDLRQYVALIETNYHQETRVTFETLAKHFTSQGEKQLAEFFDAYAKAGGFGTGWVYVAANGDNFVITNRHVVSQAATVNLSFEQPDGSYKTFADAPIVYVDDFMDLAVVQFPGGAKVFAHGFPIDTSFKQDGTQLFSAGFPAFGGKPLWQFSTGIVTNSRARPVGFPGYDYLVQHSAQIDKGNSGGPLMVRDAASVTGFAVIGVNTWKATQRENTNFSIPAKVLPAVIENARKAVAMRASAPAMRTALEQTCRVLAAELRSPNPDVEKIHQFISYAQVGRRGWDAFEGILGAVDDKKTWEESFFEDPIETMRTSLFYLFWLSLDKHQEASPIEFREVSAADQDKIGKAEAIRTEFLAGGKATEISWTWEYGQWRVVDFELPAIAKAQPSEQQEAAKPEDAQQAAPEFGSYILVGASFYAGSSNGYGNVYGSAEFPTAGTGTADDSVFSWSASLSVEVPVTSLFWIEGQLNLVKKGRYYQWNSPPDTNASNNIWVREEILYLQVPAMAELHVSMVEGLSFTLAAGPAVNIAVAPGGLYWDYLNTQYNLPSTWYDGSYFNPIALSAVAEASVRFGLGGSLLCISGKVDYDLTTDFNYGSGETSHFLTLSGGLSWKFPIVLKKAPK